MNPNAVFILTFISFASLAVDNAHSLKKEDCEGKQFTLHYTSIKLFHAIKHLFSVSVCFTVLERFSQELTDDVKKSPEKIETEFKKFCKTTSNSQNSAKLKENKFVSCFFSVTE